MRNPPTLCLLKCRLLTRVALAVPVLSLVALGAGPAHAEKADRFKPINVEAELPGKIDLLNQFVVFNGNVVVTKGTMIIRAGRIEVRETPEGYHNAVAFGSAAVPATFRQRRDEADEFIEGRAERLEFDGKSDVVKFITNASVKRLRGSTVADEINGNLVTYDSATEVFNVSGGTAPTAANPTGRIRAVLVPREGSAAAAEAAQAAAAASAASGPASSAAAASAPATTLKTSPLLGAPR